MKNVILNNVMSQCEVCTNFTCNKRNKNVVWCKDFNANKAVNRMDLLIQLKQANRELLIKNKTLEGAKENGVVWHDLRKDPNDLPKDNKREYLVFLDWLGKKYELLKLCEIKSFVENIIAWCEIPQFKE